ncbi:glycosyltransferase family 39 protein [Frigidibacter sp. RF13]|uniref:ArnT family glycosyltransferase n=1 Tax=Frigidibacter sp. RF13 TaxID=2997340 RepID=UPI002271A742|nr:glycosyltransferase family 39 protein [Frigidibacter sp. RF13]MCY1125420.1 glycosyltransferase family 39 protein [Frigidibacter sp. RF13]
MSRLTLGPLLGLYFLLLALLVWARPLLPVDETRYLAVAWEIHLSGDPFHLTRNFAPYADKPPLLFWLINLVWMVTGVNEFAARLVGPAFAVAMIGASAALAARLWRDQPSVPRDNAIILGNTLGFLLFGGATMFDTMLGLAVLLSLRQLWRIGIEGQGGWRSWAGLGLAFTFGFYAKGPVILLHLAAPLLFFRWWAVERIGARRFGLGLGLAFLVLALGALLWLVPALLTATPDFRHELLWRQSAGRLGGGLAHDRPFWFFLVVLPVLLFPWSLSRPFWKGLADAAGSGDPGLRLCLTWFAGAFVLFSLTASKQAHYLVPELPAAALLTARMLADGRRPVASAASWLCLIAGLAILSLALLDLGGLTARFLPDLLSAGQWALVGLLILLLGPLSARLGFVAGQASLGFGLVAVLYLVAASGGMFREYDSEVLRQALVQSGNGPWAVTGAKYEAQLNFAGRAIRAIPTLSDRVAIEHWAAATPAGVLFGPVEGVAVEVAPERSLRYDGVELGIWSARAIAASAPHIKVSPPSGSAALAGAAVLLSR